MSFHRLFALIVASCLTCFTVGTAPAQVSLDLSGAENIWFYGSYGQLGSRGFFGDYNVDAGSTGGNFASLNAWVGNQGDIGNLVSGSNAGISSFNLKITPKFGLDWATLTARYNINAYNTSGAPGSVTPVSPGQLTLWNAVIRTPVTDIRFGKRVFQYGCNLQFGEIRTTEYLMLERMFAVPDVLGCLVCSGILPKKAMSWFNPHLWPRYQRDRATEKVRVLGGKVGETAVGAGEVTIVGQQKTYDPEYLLYGGDKATGKSNFELWKEKQLEDEDFRELLEGSPDEQKRKKCWPNDTDPYAWGHIGPACLRIGFGFFPWETFAVPTPIAPPYITFWNPQDLGINQTQNFIALAAYSSTDLEFGVGCLRSVYHQGPELQQGVALRVATPTFERYVTEGWSYLKYNNGRFFFSTELDWFNRVYRFQRSLNGTFFGIPDNVDGSGSLFASKYWESWRYMAEGGFWCGPFAARGFYCFMPGPDRRHGIYIDRQPFIQENPQQAFGLFDPYSILLAYRFGSGVNAPAHISDASVYAVKLDYALAANLIVEGSFLRAIRNSHGYAIGYVRPNIAAGAFGNIVYAEPPGSTFINPAPSVPDRDLGWEAMAGFTWQLMDQWVVSGRFSYWQPGKWFNYACIDKSVPNWDIPSAANNWGVRPDRVIDPVFALEIQMSASY